jgi:hypothetical protein
MGVFQGQFLAPASAGGLDEGWAPRPHGEQDA